eukprot:5922693-Prymnesium_polylepis.1
MGEGCVKGAAERRGSAAAVGGRRGEGRSVRGEGGAACRRATLHVWGRRVPPTRAARVARRRRRAL